MDKQFDELSKSLADGVSRREALRKFGAGLAGLLFVAIGLGSAGRAYAAAGTCCTYFSEKGNGCDGSYEYHCIPPGTACPQSVKRGACYPGYLFSQTSVSHCNQCGA